MADWYGSTAGADSGSTYPSASMQVTTAGVLNAIRVWVLAAGVYQLSAPGIEREATATAPGEVTFGDLNLTPGSRTFTLQAGMPVKVRYLNIATPYSPGEGITQGQWVEFGNSAYTLPWAFSMEAPLAVDKWGSPHDMATDVKPAYFIAMRRERFPAYQASGVGDGDGDREVTEGQVWPR